MSLAVLCERWLVYNIMVLMMSLVDILWSSTVWSHMRWELNCLCFGLKHSSNAFITEGCLICSPGRLHSVFGEIDDPVDQVESAKGERKEDAGVLVNDAGASQYIVGRNSWALLQEGLGTDRRVGECFCRAFKELRRIHSLLQHTTSTTSATATTVPIRLGKENTVNAATILLEKAATGCFTSSYKWQNDAIMIQFILTIMSLLIYAIW